MSHRTEGLSGEVASSLGNVDICDRFPKLSSPLTEVAPGDRV
jgi:hypothetical protein